MTDQLFPVVEVPEFASEDTEYDDQYKRSVKWNPGTGDFARDGAGRMVACEGREAFAIWCFKMAQSERYECLAYPDQIGVEMERAMGNDDEKTVESMVQRTITDALMINPRTENVWDFEFMRDGDSLHCSFKVKGVAWNEVITVSI